MDYQPTQEWIRPAGDTRRRDGVGSSGGRVLAAINRAMALNEMVAPADSEAEGQELARLERIYSARRERERMFEQQARMLDALLSLPPAAAG